MNRLSDIETKRADKLKELNGMLEARDQSATEFTPDQVTRFDALTAEVETLNDDYAREQKAENLRKQTALNKSNQKTPEQKIARQFSFVKAINAKANGNPLEGVEREVSEEAQGELRGTGQSIQGVGIPSWMVNIKGSNVLGQKRDMYVGGSNVGAEWVQTLEIGHQYGLEIAPSAFGLGVEVLSGLSSTVYLTETGEAAAVWETEVASADETNPATSKPVTLSPKRLAATTDVSRQLMIQAGGSVAEERVRTQLQKAINRKLDWTIYQGTGVSPIPYGIINTSGINSSTGVGVPDNATFWTAWAEIVADNADIDTINLVLTPALYAFLANAPIDAGSGRFILEGNKIIGVNVSYSNNMPSGTMLLGVFNQSVVGQWGGIDLMVNPYTKSKEAIVEVTVNSFFDVGVKRPLSFCKMTDVTTS